MDPNCGVLNLASHSNTSGTCGDLLWTAVEGLECPNPLTKCMCLWENHLKWWEFSKKNIGHIPFFWENIISSHCFWEVPRCSWNFHKRFCIPPSWQATFEGCGSAEKMGPDYFGSCLWPSCRWGSHCRTWGSKKNVDQGFKGSRFFFFSAFLLVDPKNEFQENEMVLRQRRWDI